MNAHHAQARGHGHRLVRDDPNLRAGKRSISIGKPIAGLTARTPSRSRPRTIRPGDLVDLIARRGGTPGSPPTAAGLRIGSRFIRQTKLRSVSVCGNSAEMYLRSLAPAPAVRSRQTRRHRHLRQGRLSQPLRVERSVGASRGVRSRTDRTVGWSSNRTIITLPSVKRVALALCK